MRFALFLLALATQAGAGQPTLTVAVASNFREPAGHLARAFEDHFDVSVKIATGSTGKLYAQIINGAPFDVFLAADAARPHRLVANNLADRQITYARGGLVFWASRSDGSAANCRSSLQAIAADESQRLAIANPETAPYGSASISVLEELGLKMPAHRLVTGENISQTYLFIDRGGVAGGFVARSMEGNISRGCRWPVPTALHAPIEQVAVRVTATHQPELSAQFLAFLQDEESRAAIRQFGYE